MNEQPQQITTQQKRYMPQNELDLNMMVTDPVWGKMEISSGLKNRLNRLARCKDEKGKEGLTTESLWDLLGFYTRDMRLANLSTFNGEIVYVSYHLDLAHDFLQCNFIEPFLICLSRAATVLELSQSKGGFLRRRMHTFSEEHIQGSSEPEKKSLFGGAKKRNEGM